MNIFAKEKKQIILRREDLVKNTRLLSKELSKLFFGNTHFFEHYLILLSLREFEGLLSITHFIY